MSALALLGAAVASPASAAYQQLTITYSGTVTSLVDPNGLFGAPTTNGTATFTDTYVFNLSNGYRVSGSGYDEIFGGSAFGVASPLIGATLTINGVKENFPGGYGDQEFYQPGQYVEAFSNQYNPSGAWNYDFIHMLVSNAPSSLDTSFSGTGSGYGWFFSCDNSSACNVYQENFGGNFNPTSVTAVVASIPEPATWAMLILGVGMIGLAARRRSGPALTA